METRTYHPNEIDSLFSSNGTLKTAIVELEKKLSSEGKVLCGIKINGMNLGPDDEIKFEKSGRSEIQQLEIKAETLANLISDSQQSLVAYFAQMKATALKASEALRAGVIKDANEMISAIVDGTSWVTDMLNQIRILHPAFYKVEREWIRVENEFLRVSRELLESFERDDMVLLADNLEYEWSNSIDQWLNILSELDPKPPKDNNIGE